MTEEEQFQLRMDVDFLIKDRQAMRERIDFLEFRLLPNDPETLSRRMQQEIEDYRNGD